MGAPALSVQVNGGPPVTGDQLNTYEQTCDTVAQLRGFIGVSGVQVYLRGINSDNDGGAGVFYWNATGANADDNGVTTVIPSGSSAGNGEWTRVSGVVNLANMTTTQKNALAASAGWMVWDTTLGKACVYTGSAWQTITSA
jgi:hypothetical protein